ncbi:hypothetical protein [Rhizobium alvei]|uniref:Uncharacterized protein n=1 Tax=Rhizobium alvei TaxID=1132659 RepID=A0ABT8YR14_9HYPH|nr:hypothetical protein [Rhizobium alvei]MDO6965783.1 hypothetical protein [Rhizobium alvei]
MTTTPHNGKNKASPALAGHTLSASQQQLLEFLLQVGAQLELRPSTTRRDSRILTILIANHETPALSLFCGADVRAAMELRRRATQTDYRPKTLASYGASPPEAETIRQFADALEATIAGRVSEGAVREQMGHFNELITACSAEYEAARQAWKGQDHG